MNTPFEADCLNKQESHWNTSFTAMPEMFGLEASAPAGKAADIFARAGVSSVLELGAGQGRDTVFFAQQGFTVHALDYSSVGVEAINARSRKEGLAGRITAVQHDVRKPLPLAAASVQACYSHMLLCMALTRQELECILSEVHRVLQPGGTVVYTVRHTGDPHYGTGLHRGEDRYEVGGFIVHFFNRQLVEHLAQGFSLLEVEEFEEGALPRKLFRVVMQKNL